MSSAIAVGPIQRMGTPAPNATATSIYPTPTPRIPLSGEDFWANARLWVDARLISNGALGEGNTLEISDILLDRYYLCYRMPLALGLHTLQYQFDWTEGNIHQEAKWSFRIVE